jgi:hypothetical protein
MRARHYVSIAVGATAVLAVAATATAQEKPTGLLYTLDVRQLVAHAEPADHARLGVHFSALADRYAAEAKRHKSMSQSFVGNPSRNLGTGMSAHCKRLADLNTESATTARELAASHEKLASGASATLPRDAARFHGGAGAPEPSENELNALAAQARTPAGHHALEEYFITLAKRYTTEGNEHITLAQTYRGTRIAWAASHHDRLARLARDAAKEASEAADLHKQLARVVR